MVVIMIDYDRAVEICAAHFASVLSGSGPQKVAAFKDSNQDAPVVVGLESPPSIDQIRGAPHEWVRLAKDDCDAHTALIVSAQQARKTGTSLPRPIEEWLMGLALGEITPPDRDKRETTDTIHALIYHAIAALVIQMGIAPMRNPGLGRNSTLQEYRSACDIVAAAFVRVRQDTRGQLPGSYDRVRKIWQKSTRSFPFDPAEYQRFAAVDPSSIWADLAVSSQP
jgi:hypothetical protein